MRQEREGKGSQGKEGEEKGGEKDYSDDGAGALRARALLSLSCFRVHVFCLHFPSHSLHPCSCLPLTTASCACPFASGEQGKEKGRRTSETSGVA